MTSIDRPDVAGRDWFAAMPTGQHRGGLVAAAHMDEPDARTGRASSIAITPLHQGDEHGVQVTPLLRQAVLEARGALLVAAPLQDAMRLERAQARRQDVAGDAQV